MARIRTIKPEFPQSESVGRLSREARLLFIQIWTVVDDYGRARAAPKLLSGQLYPYDEDADQLMAGWLSELEQAGFIRLYQVDGSQYLDIPTWGKHQRIDNAGKSNIPEFRGDSPRIAANDGEPPLDLGPRKGPRTNAASRPEVSDEEADLFRRGKEVLGPSSGGMIKNLLKAKSGKVPLARAAIEQAATKGDPREYVAAIVKAGTDPPVQRVYRW